MEKNKQTFQPNDKARKIVIAVIFYLSLAGVFLINHFFFLNRSDRVDGNNDNIVFLIFGCSFALLFLIGYLLNIFIFKRKNAYLIMNAISDGGSVFCLFSAFAILLASSENLSFNRDYISLFVNSSFALLGFGLTVTAILSPYLVKTIKKASGERQVEVVLAQILPYFFFFGLGLLYTISALLDLQFQDKGYYQIVIYKSLFYSVLQMAFLVFQVIQGIIISALDKMNN